MKSVMTVFTLLLVLTWSLSSLAVDEKKIEKKIWVQKNANKAGLGIMVTPVSKEKDGRENGARIIEVFDESEADAIGLEKGDIITEINKQTVNEPADLVKALKDLEEGQEVSLIVVRDGQTKDFKAVLKPFRGHVFAFHGDDFNEDATFDFNPSAHAGKFSRYMQVPEIAGFDGKGGYLGVQVKNLSDQLQTYFEVDNGVLIEEVMKDSPAEKAGLKAGDVITSINDRKIEDPRDLVRTVNYYNPDEEVEVTFTRKGSQDEVKVILTKKPGIKWNARKLKGPRGMQIIKDDDGEEIIIDEEGDAAIFKFNDSKGRSTIEVNKEILIL